MVAYVGPEDLPLDHDDARVYIDTLFPEGVRGFDLRRSRSSGLARTHLRQTLNAVAMNMVRMIT